MKRKTMLITTDEDPLVDLTLHGVSATLIAEFAQKIVTPYYKGNLNMAIQDLINKSIADQDYVYSHITHIRKEPKTGR